MTEKEDKKKTVAFTVGDSPSEATPEHVLTSLERILNQVAIPGTDLAKVKNYHFQLLSRL